MAKQYQQNKQAQLAEEMNQKLYELLEKSGVSFASTNNGDWEKLVSGTLDAVGLSGSAKESILRLGKLSFTSQDEVLSYMQSIKGYSNFLKGVGLGTGTFSAILSLKDYYNNPTTANFLKFTTNVISMTNPYLGFTIGAFNMTESSKGVYQYLGNQINNGCNCNAGGSIYKAIHGKFNYNGYMQREAW